MEKLKPILDKLMVVLEHIEKIILVGALAALAWFAYGKLGGLKDAEGKLEKSKPSKVKNPYESGGDAVQAKDVSPFFESLSAARNTNEAPRVQFFEHDVFHPKTWMHNESQGIFPEDDGPNRRMGVKALVMEGAPQPAYLWVRPEIRIQVVNGERRIIGHYISVRDTTHRYQTMDTNLFSNRLLHSFLPSTNVVFYGTDKQSGKTASDVSPPTLKPFVEWNQVTSAGETNKFCTHVYVSAYEVVRPDNRQIHIIRHPNSGILRQMVRQKVQGYGPIGANPQLDPYRHPERIIVKYNTVTSVNSQYLVDMELWLYDPKLRNPNSAVIEFKGRNRLPAFILGVNDPPNSNAGWNPNIYKPIPRFQYVNLVYKTPKQTLRFEGCQVGRRLYIEGEVWVVSNIQNDRVILMSDPQFSPTGSSVQHIVYQAGRQPTVAGGP